MIATIIRIKPFLGDVVLRTEYEDTITIKRDELSEMSYGICEICYHYGYAVEYDPTSPDLISTPTVGDAEIEMVANEGDVE